MDNLQTDLFTAPIRTTPPPTGEQLKRAGIDRTRESNRQWFDTAVTWFKRWHKPATFRMEQFRLWAESQTPPMPEPASPHAWGALAQRLVRQGEIVATSQYEPATSPRTHGHPVMVYRTRDSQ